MAIARMACLKCGTEEIFNFVRGFPRCCQCDTPWRPLSAAEQAEFSNRRVRAASENADAVARQRAKNSHAKTYVRSSPLTCGHREVYLATGRCRECSLQWQFRRYQKLNPGATPRGRSAARDAAIEAGHKTYAEGPCRDPLHGFAPERYVSNRFCVACAAQRVRLARPVAVAS